MEIIVSSPYSKVPGTENYTAFQDLNPLFIGHEACAKGHRFGPSIRGYYLIHFVGKGAGTFYVDGRSLNVHTGEMFLIRPGEITVYAADANDPWEYSWIAFDGKYARRFDLLTSRVNAVSEYYFNKLKEFSENGSVQADSTLVLLYTLTEELFREEQKRVDAVETIKSYIRNNYMKDLTVEQLAKLVYLDRRYIGRKFKEREGRTIQHYLISVRLGNAAEFLKSGYSVTQTALLCGYRDVFNFSKIFKKYFSVSPGNYKKTH